MIKKEQEEKKKKKRRRIRKKKKGSKNGACILDLNKSLDFSHQRTTHCVKYSWRLEVHPKTSLGNLPIMPLFSGNTLSYICLNLSILFKTWTYSDSEFGL